MVASFRASLATGAQKQNYHIFLILTFKTNCSFKLEVLQLCILASALMSSLGQTLETVQSHSSQSLSFLWWHHGACWEHPSIVSVPRFNREFTENVVFFLKSWFPAMMHWTDDIEPKLPVQITFFSLPIFKPHHFQIFLLTYLFFKASKVIA